MAEPTLSDPCSQRSTIMSDQTMSEPVLRFGVGDSVLCKTSATMWKKGKVVKLHYREASWPLGRVAPYQVRLDVGNLIFAPQDSDCLIRADDGAEELVQGVEVLVCQAGPCRRAGGEAVLLEIEELASSVGGSLKVQESGCLGNCSQAPNALLVTGEDEQMFARLCDLSATAALVKCASGRAPSLDDAQLVTRLQRARRLRVRMQAREESKWNLALSGLAEDIQRAMAQGDCYLELVQEHSELLAAAGLGDKALEVHTRLGSLSNLGLRDIPTLRLLLERAKLLASLGRVADVEALAERVDQLEPRGDRETKLKSQVSQSSVTECLRVPLIATCCH